MFNNEILMRLLRLKLKYFSFVRGLLKKLHCKPILCNENRVPAMRSGSTSNENRFFPVRKSSQ